MSNLTKISTKHNIFIDVNLCKGTNLSEWRDQVFKIYWRIEPKNDVDQMYYELEIITDQESFYQAIDDGY